jgi:ribosomal-protein-alanine N-acetyltransferase
VYYFVEPMREDDIPMVQEIERLSFTTPWSTNTYRSELRNPSARYIVARVSEREPPPRVARSAEPHGLIERIQQWLRSLNSQPEDPDLDPRRHIPIIGYGGVMLAVDEGHITTIASSPAQRGQGVGELLLLHLIDEALDLGAERLTLEVRVSNNVAQQLYLKYGFEPVGYRKRYYTDNGEDAMLMTTPPIREVEYQQQLQRLRTALQERLRSGVKRRELPETEPAEGSIQA